MSVQVPAAPLLFQLTVHAPGEAVQDGTRTWASDTQVRGLDGVPGLWQAIAGPLGVNDLLALPPSLYLYQLVKIFKELNLTN